LAAFYLGPTPVSPVCSSFFEPNDISLSPFIGRGPPASGKPNILGFADQAIGLPHHRCNIKNASHIGKRLLGWNGRAEPAGHYAAGNADDLFDPCVFLF